MDIGCDIGLISTKKVTEMNRNEVNHGVMPSFITLSHAMIKACRPWKPPGTYRRRSWPASISASGEMALKSMPRYSKDLVISCFSCYFTYIILTKFQLFSSTPQALHPDF